MIQRQITGKSREVFCMAVLYGKKMSKSKDVQNMAIFLVITLACILKAYLRK